MARFLEVQGFDVTLVTDNLLLMKFATYNGVFVVSPLDKGNDVIIDMNQYKMKKKLVKNKR